MCSLSNSATGLAQIQALTMTNMSKLVDQFYSFLLSVHESVSVICMLLKTVHSFGLVFVGLFFVVVEYRSIRGRVVKEGCHGVTIL